MSSSQTPISPARFAEAIRDLPLSTLSLKVFELRNSIAHLDYSNEELKPFAAGTAGGGGGEPDQDCVDAIRENEVVIKRMLERIELLKVEVETRGASWEELGGERKEGEEKEGDREEGLDNGESEGGERSSAWTDGTFQTGRIVNGEVRMDDATAATVPSANGVSESNTAVNGTANGSAGGRLDDEALRAAMEERMRNLSHEDDDDEGGMHL